MSTNSARILLVLALIGFPWILWGALRVENRTDDMRQWLPSGRLELQQYDWYVENFGADDFLIVSWEGCTLEDPRLQQFAAGIRQRIEQQKAEGQTPLVRRVLTGRELLLQLTRDPVKLPPSEALTRLQGSFIGKDKKLTAAVVEFSDLAATPAAESIQVVYDVAQQSCNLQPNKLHLGGGVYEAVFIDQQSKRDLLLFIVPSCLVGFLTALFSLKSMRLTFVVLGIAVYCALLSVSLVYYGGGKLNAVMVVLPTLVFVLVVSGGVHLANYFREALQKNDSTAAAQHALSVGWLPCSLATGSTAIGLFSLLVSQIQPVKAFGFYAAVSLLLSLGILLLLFVAAFVDWPSKTKEKEPAEKSPSQISSHVNLPQRITAWLVHNHLFVSLGCLSLLLAMSCGLAWTTTSVKIERMFRHDSELMKNYGWLEESLGPLASLEMIITFDAAAQDDILARTQLINKIQSAVAGIESIGTTLSAASLVPSTSNLGGLGATARRALIRTALNDLAPRLTEDGFLSTTETGQHWKITTRLPALSEFDYPSVAKQAQQRIDTIVADDPFFTDVGVTFTGACPLIDGAQRQLLDDLANSFLLAFAFICPLMMLILRSFWAGLIAMLPNILPVATIFGGMGWLGIPIDIGTVLTCSVALGIALDDTLHFLTWFRRGVSAGLERQQAIIQAHEHCRAAMIQTTLICGLAMLVFVASSFVPTSQFALLMFLLLLAALIGDLIFLPALLAGPVGRLFIPTRSLAVETVVSAEGATA